MSEKDQFRNMSQGMQYAAQRGAMAMNAMPTPEPISKRLGTMLTNLLEGQRMNRTRLQEFGSRFLGINMPPTDVENLKSVSTQGFLPILEEGLRALCEEQEMLAAVIQRFDQQAG